MAAISFESVTKSYGSAEVIHGVDLEVADRELMVFVGPSGCGKSTLLRMIAGLETVTGGVVRIGDRAVNDVEPRHRDIAMVFQDYALYPHKTVRDNMGFGLRMRGVTKDRAGPMIEEAARILQIEHLLDRRPGQLSGGQRQRVAMGRAIVRRPSAFLFDEPLSNLDAKLRVDMRMEIKRLHRLLKTTTVYVTHDQVEAMTLADRITVLRAGRIEQVGTPAELYDRPANLFVAEFIGSPAMNLVEARLVRARGSCLARIGDNLSIPLADPAAEDGSPIVIGIRPEHLERNSFDDASSLTTLHAKTDLVEPLGSDTLALCRLPGLELLARLTPGRVTGSGQAVELTVDPQKIHIFSKTTGERL